MLNLVPLDYSYFLIVLISVEDSRLYWVLKDKRIPIVALEVANEGVLLAVLVGISVLIEDSYQNGAEKDGANSIVVLSGLAILIVAEKLTTAIENAVDEEETSSLVVLPGLAILNCYPAAARRKQWY